jgi:hypothetical protein
VVQTVSDWPFTAGACVCAWVSPCGICDGQSGTGTDFSLRSLVFPCQYHSIVANDTHISSVGCTVSPLVAAVWRRSLIPLT